MKFLSEEFLAALVAAEREPLGSATCAVSVKTEGGPDGKVAFTIDLENGVVVDAQPGARKGADIELTAPYDLAAELLRGDLDPAVAFMRGTLKMSGDMDAWLEILPAWHRARADGAASSIAADTEF